ncbi:MAG: class I SAM-dependent methyltransferase [Candidatus Heimdallarchaeota archaeon]|nr:class I SAM-dependent methyltransferase [Candidatus Heimdallarchaeota archaeon]MCK4876247.1 class I SAM-dependent methyltransferase [Candidatus Heimdallarchaeota archaeon]
MNSKKTIKDKQFSLFSHKIARMFEPSKKIVEPYIKEGQVVADLGCGPGYYSLHMAKILGPDGIVYSVDSDEKSIKALKRKAEKRGFQNIEAYSSSASNLSFIEEGSVDFIFANGLLCCVAPQDVDATVNEIKRILKPEGTAYLSAARGFGSYMKDEKWEKILKEFKIHKRKDKKTEKIAEVSLK